MGILELHLTCGRTITLREFFQRETYADMLLGSPNRRLNDFLFGRLESQTREILGDHNVFVIEPKVIELPDGSERLPQFSCMGKFVSFAPSDEGGVDATALSICWFEENAENHMNQFQNPV